MELDSLIAVDDIAVTSCEARCLYGLVGYAIVETLHESARSVVHRATRLADGRRVILKILGDDYPSPVRLARFEREFRIARALTGPGFVEALALEAHENTKRIVFEDLGAISLDRVLAERSLSSEEVLSIACRLTEALGRVHAAGFIHKDLNPSNIVYQRETGAIGIIDFGCATELASERGDVLEGTTAYMSPEQTGRMNREVDYRTDFYALGATLHHLATGAPPFVAGDTLELIHCHLARVPPRLDAANPAMPPMLAEIVLGLLAKTAEARYQTAAGILADLERCRGELARGANEPFAIGQADVSDRFQVPERLYGREDDVSAILAAFERASAGRAEAVLVKGDPGIGKSSLIRELQRPMVGKRGYVVWGKFDHYRRDVPYSGLIQALTDAVRQILAEPEDELADRRRALAEALGANGRVISAVLPEVELVMGAQPPLPELPPYEAQVRFNFAFRSFFGALVSARRPLVVVLDDLQWADLPSLKLIELLLTDSEIHNLVVVGAYRDSEVDALHPLSLSLRAVEKAGVQVSTIALRPLALGDVGRVVADTLRCAADEARPIAEICLEKTAGNPFFLRQFLRALHDAGLLAFDRGAGAWRGSVEAIREAGITDNVIELMVGRISVLPDATQEALRLAACLGGTFALAMLSTVYGRPRTETAAALWPALAGGALVPLGADYKFVADSDACDVAYRFVHDHVQQAAYSLISPDELAAAHLRIGRVMLQGITTEARHERLFDLVSHLNIGSVLIDDPRERDELADLNLAAGTRMRDAAAYVPALRCLTLGRSLLGARAWERRYPQMRALTLAAAEAADFSERVAEREALIAEVLQHARTLLDKVPAYEIRLRASLRRREHHACLTAGMEILGLLGLSLPISASKLDAGLALGRSKLLMLGKSTSALATLPPMTDPHTLAAMRLVGPIATAAYLCEPNLMPVIAHRQLRLTLKFGMCPESALAYSGWGLMLSAALGSFEEGHALGELALRLTERPAAKRYRAQATFTNTAFILHWTQPLRATLPAFLEGYRAGVESGDLTFGIYCAIMRVTYGFVAGLPLDDVARDATAVGVTMRRVDHVSPHVIIIHQAVANLMGDAADPCRLTGDVGDEAAILAELHAGSDGSSHGIFHLVKLMLAYLFHDHRAAAEHAQAASTYAESMIGLAYLPMIHFFTALNELALQATGPGAAPRRAPRSVRVALKKLRGWAAHAPMNHAHRVALVEAELARCAGETAQAREGYDRAVELSREHGWAMDEAIAGELAARFHLERGRAQMAALYARSARQAYQRWGAAAKVRDLEDRYADLRRRSGGEPARAGASQGTTTDSTTSSTLDFLSVMKASQAISSEILLHGLLQTLMHTLLESAGARRGVLILRGDHPMMVELDEGAGGLIDVRDDEPGASADVPVALVRYVERTLERVVLGDTARAGQMDLDAYVARRRARSMLAAPILNQQRLVGVLYLENDLVADAFTPERCRVLEMLSAQAAISLENARLYDTLESRVKQRTRELSQALQQLRDAQRQLIVQEKLASLSVLTSGIAHELKNPLNFVTNFAELADGLIAEIGETVERAAARIDRDDVEILESAAADLRENVAKIQEHGKRASRIVSAMLEHSQVRVAEARESDLNALVRQHGDAAYRSAGPGSSVPGTLEFHLDDSIGPLMLMPEALGKVIKNLVSNAVYFARLKAQSSLVAPTITISTRTRGDRVELRVRDNGIGIPAAAHDKIFSPFFTTKPTGEGTGLGLFISYDIVSRGHGGLIDFETREGHFSEFVVSLPRVAFEREAETDGD